MTPGVKLQHIHDDAKLEAVWETMTKTAKHVFLNEFQPNKEAEMLKLAKKLRKVHKKDQ